MPEKKTVPDHLSVSDRQKFKYLFYEGIRLKEEGKVDEALSDFQMCYQLDSLDAGLNSELGNIYAGLKMYEDARKCFEKSVSLVPDNWWFNMQLLTVYVQANKADKAIGLMEKVETIFPYKEDVYRILESLYKQSGHFDKAITAFDKLEQIAGIDESIAIEKFGLYQQLKKPKKAIAEIDKLVQKYPSEPRYKVIRGDIYLQQGQPEKAFDVYNSVLKSDPDNPYVYVSLSDYYNKTGSPEKANEAIVKALKLDQLDVDQKIDILGQYVQKLIQDTVKLDETESLFKLLVDKYPMEEQVHGYYALFLQYRKRYAEAESELETMLNINSKNEKTWLQLIQLKITNQNYSGLLDVTNRAIDAMPDKVQWYFYKGIALFQLGKLEEALKTNRQAIALTTGNQQALKSDIYAQIGDIYYKLTERDSAYTAYDKALEINPANIYVMNNYAYYLSEQNTDLKKAEKLSAKTIEKEPKNSTYLDTYAWIFYQQGNYSLAKFYIERAIDNLESEKDAGVVLEHYGDILFQTGDKEKALIQWKKSYESGNKTDALKEKIEVNSAK
ncbi:MAG: tetratricopeptide repeat protein [Paludibacter sp.]|nr:tetratricopeptide repeat protein [Paludibacter sp.]